MWCETVNPLVEWSHREVAGVPTRTAPGKIPQYWCRKTFWTNIPGLDPDATMELVEAAITTINNYKQ